MVVDKVQTLGECFTGIGLRVDTREELDAIAKKKNYTIAQSPITRVWPNGYVLRAHSAPSIQTMRFNGKAGGVWAIV